MNWTESPADYSKSFVGMINATAGSVNTIVGGLQSNVVAGISNNIVMGGLTTVSVPLNATLAFGTYLEYVNGNNITWTTGRSLTMSDADSVSVSNSFSQQSRDSVELGAGMSDAGAGLWTQLLPKIASIKGAISKVALANLVFGSIGSAVLGAEVSTSSGAKGSAEQLIATGVDAIGLMAANALLFRWLTNTIKDLSTQFASMAAKPDSFTGRLELKQDNVTLSGYFAPNAAAKAAADAYNASMSAIDQAVAGLVKNPDFFALAEQRDQAQSALQGTNQKTSKHAINMTPDSMAFTRDSTDPISPTQKNNQAMTFADTGFVVSNTASGGTAKIEGAGSAESVSMTLSVSPTTPTGEADPASPGGKLTFDKSNSTLTYGTSTSVTLTNTTAKLAQKGATVTLSGGEGPPTESAALSAGGATLTLKASALTIAGPNEGAKLTFGATGAQFDGTIVKIG